MKTLKENEGVFEVKDKVVNELLDIERTIKALELKKKQIVDSILYEMKESNQKSLSNDLATFSYIEEVKKTTFDSSKFKKENEDLYLKYSKESVSKESVRVTWKVATDPEVLKKDSEIVSILEVS